MRVTPFLMHSCALVNAPQFFRKSRRRCSPCYSRPPLVNAPRFFRNGPRGWSPGFSRPPLVNAPRFFRNSPRGWSRRVGFSPPWRTKVRPTEFFLDRHVVNASQFFRKSRRRWSPGFSRPALVNAARFFRVDGRRIRLPFRPYHPASSHSSHPGGLPAMCRTRARRSLAGKSGPVLLHGSLCCLHCVSCRRFLLQTHLLDLDQEIPGLDLRAQERGRLADHAGRFKGVVGNRLGEIVFQFQLPQAIGPQRLDQHLSGHPLHHARRLQHQLLVGRQDRLGDGLLQFHGNTSLRGVGNPPWQPRVFGPYGAGLERFALAAKLLFSALLDLRLPVLRTLPDPFPPKVGSPRSCLPAGRTTLPIAIRRLPFLVQGYTYGYTCTLYLIVCPVAQPRFFVRNFGVR